MLCFHINRSLKQPLLQTKYPLDAQEARTDQLHDFWMPEFDCVDPLCYFKIPHKCGFDISINSDLAACGFEMVTFYLRLSMIPSLKIETNWYALYLK